jgi:hypothetical protein
MHFLINISIIFLLASISQATRFRNRLIAPDTNLFDNAPSNHLPVRLAAYAGVISNNIPSSSNNLQSTIEHFSIAQGHTELFIGDIAYSVCASKTNQWLEFRWVRNSQQHNGHNLKLEVPLCTTERSHAEIQEFVKDNWKGSYCGVGNNCRDFAQFLLDYVCPGAEIPEMYRAPERLMHGMYKGLVQRMGNVVDLNHPMVRKLHRKFEKKVLRAHDSTEWELRSYLNDEDDE